MVQFVIAPPPKKKIHLVFSSSPILKSSRKYWIIAQQNQAPTLGPGQDSHNQLLFSLQWPGLGSLASASCFLFSDPSQISSKPIADIFPTVIQANFFYMLQLFLKDLFPFSFLTSFCKFKAVVFLKLLDNLNHRTVLVVLL